VIVAVVVPRLTAPAAVFCGLVAFSRVVVGAHYPSDVVGGFLLGAAYTWFYALALAEAGMGFAHGPGGTIRARVIAIRRVFWRPKRLHITAVGR
jgi:undecaprenyl-diphosphatase